MISLTKFNLKPYLHNNNPVFAYIVFFDFIILSLYLIIFHFNKYVNYGNASIKTSNTVSPQYLNLSHCLGIISIKRNNQIYVDGNYYNISQLQSHIKSWKIHFHSYTIIYCYDNTNLDELFNVMEMLRILNVPEVYITSSQM